MENLIVKFSSSIKYRNFSDREALLSMFTFCLNSFKNRIELWKLFGSNPEFTIRLFKSSTKFMLSDILIGKWTKFFFIFSKQGRKRSLKLDGVNIIAPCAIWPEMLAFVSDAYATVRRMNFLQVIINHQIAKNYSFLARLSIS